MRWIIQNNLISENDYNVLESSCTKLGVDVQGVVVIPMVNELPDFDMGDNNIYYGSTTFMNNLYNQLKPKGLFYNHETFSMENYINKWGEHMLNCDAMILPIKDVLNNNGSYRPNFDSNVFIRPDGDGKEFDGQVMQFHEVPSYLQRHLDYESKMTLDTKIVLGPAYNIHKEWRNYVVDGKVVTSSLYRQNFKLKKSGDDIPQSMLDFVQERINEYKPHDNFAIDIASTHDGTYYIIECGCLNSVGLYHCDIPKLVESITNYMSK